MTQDNSQLIFVTGNANKAREVEALLGRPLRTMKGSETDDEAQSMDLEHIAYRKAQAAYRYAHETLNLRGMVIVEDVSLELPSWDDLPGPFVRFFLLGEPRTAHLLQMANRDPERRATAICCMTLITDRMCDHFIGRCEGRIAQVPRGESAFGFDPIFVPDGQDLTFAEMTAEAKNAVSHRGIAVRKLKAHLDRLGL